MDVHVTRDKYGCEGFEVTLGGDCELETIIAALIFITKVLEDGSKEVLSAQGCRPRQSAQEADEEKGEIC